MDVRYNRNVSLTPCSDLSPADWIVTSELPWERLVTFGPSGFPACARLRFIPDPAYEGQQEHEAYMGADHPSENDTLRVAFGLLAAHTSTPDSCYFCLWEGWGPALRSSVLQGPKVLLPDRAAVPARAYFLFHGPLSEAGEWGSAEDSTTEPRGYKPAFVWPSDHAWCVASDVDPHWAGIAGDTLLIDQLIAEPRLDAVAADPSHQQPAYR